MEAKNLASETKLKQKIQFFSFRATIPKTIFDRQRDHRGPSTNDQKVEVVQSRKAARNGEALQR